MLNADTSRGQVLFTADDYRKNPPEGGAVEFVACMDETELLTALRDVAKHYDSVITFKGGGLTLPFIYMGSAVLNVPISRRDWLGCTLPGGAALRLADQLTFYGGGRPGGATRRFNPGLLLQGLWRRVSRRARASPARTSPGSSTRGVIARWPITACGTCMPLCCFIHVWRERLSGIK